MKEIDKNIRSFGKYRQEKTIHRTVDTIQTR